MSKRQPTSEEDYKEWRTRGAVPDFNTLMATVSGPLAGVAVLFIAGMATLAKGTLDTSLSVALTFFAVSLPCLLASFIFAVMRVREGERAADYLLLVGVVLEMLGVATILQRLSIPAVIAFTLAALACLFWLLLVVNAALRRERKTLEAKQNQEREP